MSAASRLDHAFQKAPVLPLSESSLYVLFSDCHRGTGTANDNFLKNQHLYFAALQHYLKQGYTYIELGDGDELWENRSLDQIKSIHNNAFWLLSQFYEKNHLYMIYGNHDMVKKKSRFTCTHCATYPCSTCAERDLFPGITFHEGIILENISGGKNIYLAHGHQADFFNCVLWKTSRFLVRYVWKPLEQIGFLDPTSAAKNNTKKHKIEKHLTSWAAENDCILVTGHTHRPMTGSPDSPYFNTGSCVHPRCVTCIEIRGFCMTLVKWSVAVSPNQSLFVSRDELVTAPISVRDFVL